MKEPTSPRNMRVVLAALAAATLTGSLGISIVTVSLPTLSRVFSTNMSQTQWIILAYLAAVTISIVTAGRLADMVCLRRILVLGLVIFALASAASAAASTSAVLVLARAVQGVGGAILTAIPISLAREIISKDRLGSAMGLMGTMSAIGTALGPSVGGTLIAIFGWRAAFIALTVCAIITTILALQAIPSRPARNNVTKAGLDLPGTFTLALALCSYALLTSGNQTITSAQTLVLWAVAIGSLLAFVVVESRSAAPLIPLRMLFERVTGAGFTMNFLIGTIMMSTLILGPFFLAFALGLDEAMVGLVMAVGPVTSALSGVPAGKLTDKFGADRVLLIGLMQTIVGLLCLGSGPIDFRMMS